MSNVKFYNCFLSKMCSFNPAGCEDSNGCACDNSIVRAFLASGIDAHDLLATTHMQIRRSYDLLGLNLHAVSGRDLTNMFVGRLERFVRTRNEMAGIRV